MPAMLIQSYEIVEWCLSYYFCGCVLLEILMTTLRKCKFWRKSYL